MRDSLQVQIYQRIFFNWDVWIHADANVQRQLLSDLTMQATENAVIDFRTYDIPFLHFIESAGVEKEMFLVIGTESLGFSPSWTSCLITFGLPRGPARFGKVRTQASSP